MALDLKGGNWVQICSMAAALCCLGEKRKPRKCRSGKGAGRTGMGCLRLSRAGVGQ